MSKTLHEEARALQEALHDLAYAILRASGAMPLLLRWGGGRPRPWVVNAARRAENDDWSEYHEFRKRTDPPPWGDGKDE